MPQMDQVQIRENLNETAFFYPQLMTDATGAVALKFTLPESLTTWRFMALAHTQDMCYGLLDGETVAKKDLMIQPNVPRFIREGDQAVIAAKIFNTCEKAQKGKAVLRLKDPMTEQVVFEQQQDFAVEPAGTTSVSFSLNYSLFTLHSSLLLGSISHVVISRWHGISFIVVSPSADWRLMLPGRIVTLSVLILYGMHYGNMATALLTPTMLHYGVLMPFTCKKFL